MVVKGYDNWLTKERLVETEAEWAQMDRSKVLQKITDFQPKTVVEFCCGTGWIPNGLPKDIEYHGFDANLYCLNLAREKNPEGSRGFTHANVIGMTYHAVTDMALAFSCLKHFTLADWDTVYGMVLDAGRHTLCSVYLAEDDREDPGYGYPHTAVSREHLERIVHEAGHEILDILVMPPLVGPKEPLVLTKLIEVTEDDGFLL
jgi:hypothetical protein